MDPSWNHWFSQNGKYCLQRKGKTKTMMWKVKKKMGYTFLTVISNSGHSSITASVGQQLLHTFPHGRELTGVPRVLAAPLAHLSSSLQPKPAGLRQSKEKNYIGSFSWAPRALRDTSGCLWDGVAAATTGWAHLNCRVLELTWLNRNADTHTAFAGEAQTGKSCIGAYDVHMYIFYIFIFLRKHCCCLCPLIYIYLFLLQYHL